MAESDRFGRCVAQNGDSKPEGRIPTEVRSKAGITAALVLDDRGAAGRVRFGRA